MNYSRLSAVALTLLVASVALAQSDSAPSSKTEPPKWSLSLGIDPTRYNSTTPYDSRIIGSLTRGWQNPGSRFSRELSLMAGTYSLSGNGVICGVCGGSSSERYLALTAGSSAELFHLWRFTPYVHGGAGLYYRRFSASNWYTGGVSTSHVTMNDFTLGINGGFGIRARVLSHEFFIDQTLHAFDFRALNRGVYPFSIGIRF